MLAFKESIQESLLTLQPPDNSTSNVQLAPTDPVFKQVLIFHCGQWDIWLQTEFEVSRLPRTIDAIIRLDPSQKEEQLQSQTPFGHFRAHNLIEFKGRRDPLTIAEYHLILGRAYLYLGEHDILPHQMTVTIVSARKPRRVLSHRLGIGFLHLASQSVIRQPLGEGYYVRNNGDLMVYLIVANELLIVPKNYPLLLFVASARKFRQFLQQLVEERNWDYIRFAYRLRPRITKEVLTMAGRYSLPKKDLEFMAKDIGAEILPFLSPEERLRGLSSEERLRGLSPEERLQGVNPRDLLMHLSTEVQQRPLDAGELRMLKQLLERQEEQMQQKA